MGEASIRIRRVDPGEGERLREIAIASKGFWGHDAERVRAWAESGDFSPEALRSKQACVAEVEGRVVGWAALLPQGDVCRLDDLWVEPAWIGRGIGSRLFRHAAEIARQLGAGRMEWEAEPNAVAFYEGMGARRLRDSEPSKFGRVLPVMGLDLLPS